MTGAAALAGLAAGCAKTRLGASADAEGRVPPPRPVSTRPYLVGAYYFPGWATLERWQALDAFPERHPLLGYYREGDPAVMDWHIKWAVEHGISFFVFDWYWDRGRRQLEHALRDGYLRARFRSRLRFCLLWANHNPPGSSSEADLMALVDHWIADYFQEPGYLTIDGRPVIIVFSPSRLRRDLGAEGVRAAFIRMRARARAARLPDLFLVGAVRLWGDTPVKPDPVIALQREGYDAGTGYNYPRAGMDERAREAPYQTMVEGYEQIWLAIARQQVLDYVPVTEPGWDSRPWEGPTALVRTGRTPAGFQDMLERARRFTDRYPVAGGRKIVLIEAWNEFGEGEAIEPHREWGFGYLDAVRAVFGAAGVDHRDVTPGQLGLSVPLAS